MDENAFDGHWRTGVETCGLREGSKRAARSSDVGIVRDTKGSRGMQWGVSGKVETIRGMNCGMKTEGEEPSKMRTTALLVTVVEAAEVLRLSRSTVYELIYSGKLPSVKIGYSRRVRVVDLEAYVRSLPDA